MPQQQQLLLLSDDTQLLSRVAALLRHRLPPPHVLRLTLLDDALTAAGRADPPVRVVVDARPPERIALLEALGSAVPHVHALVLLDAMDGRAIRRAQRAGAGAVGFFSELEDPGFLEVIFESAPTPQAFMATTTRSRLLGSSQAMNKVRGLVSRFARSDLPVLVTGETGTGKELVARAIHDESDCRRGRFVPVNCAALPHELIESAFFGHERGAFSGAASVHRGYFEQAHGGTLFLDEIGELPRAQQAKLLRVLEDGRVTRVGAEMDIHCAVRLITATNRNLEQDVENAEFRRDFYERLAILQIELPPLRHRAHDIDELAHAFAEQQAHTIAFTPGAVAAMRDLSWLGNVRALHSFVARCAAHEDRHLLDAAAIAPYLPHCSTAPSIIAPRGENGPGVRPTRLSLSELKAMQVERVLDAVAEARGNLTAAARQLNTTRDSVRRVLAQSKRARE